MGEGVGVDEGVDVAVTVACGVRLTDAVLDGEADDDDVEVAVALEEGEAVLVREDDASVLRLEEGEGVVEGVTAAVEDPDGVLLELVVEDAVAVAVELVVADIVAVKEAVAEVVGVVVPVLEELTDGLGVPDSAASCMAALEGGSSTALHIEFAVGLVARGEDAPVPAPVSYRHSAPSAVLLPEYVITYTTNAPPAAVSLRPVIENA